MGTFTEGLANFGFGVAANAANAGLGLMLEHHNDQRQLDQTRALQEIQMEGQRRMTDYNFQKQLDMWKATGYVGQKEQMQKAGLNPALMYGMGGGGGQSTNVETGNVQGQQAPHGGHEALDSAGMGIQMSQAMMQLQLLKAQKDNIEADTANKQADTGVKEVQKPNVQANTDLILQGIDNARNTYEIQKLEIAMKNIENYEKQATQPDRMDYITYQAMIAAKQLQVIGQEQQLNAATMQDKIKLIRQNAIGAVLQNTLTQVQTGQIQEQTRLTQQQIKSIANDIDISWENLSNEHKKIAIMDALKEWNIDPTKHAIDQAVNALSGLLDMSILKYEPTKAPIAPIGFKR